MKTCRSRAWRRQQRARCISARLTLGHSGDKPAGFFSKSRPMQKDSESFWREKNWKQMYIRSTKLARAKQLGFHYPRRFEEYGEHSIRL